MLFEYGLTYIITHNSVYQASLSLITFADVDECSLNITQCADNQVCHNFPGGSACLCTNHRYGSSCSIRKCNLILYTFSLKEMFQLLIPRSYSSLPLVTLVYIVCSVFFLAFQINNLTALQQAQWNQLAFS